MEILFFAVVAALVLGRLYQVLGTKTGAEPPPLNERAKHPLGSDQAGRYGLDRPDGDPVDQDGAGPGDPDGPARPPLPDTTPLGLGLAEISGRDRTFDPEGFLAGARIAYEMIVTAYGRGDTDTLKTLVDADVFEAYAGVIAQRKAEGAGPIEVVRVSDATLKSAELDGNTARIDVHFSADLQDGGDGLRPTDEIWTFERDVTSKRPDWLLCGVSAP
ncbi:MAG: Tim44/TimA family putative adaptor protein [Hyphomonadaceae bacterium]|jgi:predicted lipid-binding transport protein (Tim44 family)|nr:Tim44/TimA family putative adaptor protein [Hyphomonadaceae bacterium]